MNLLRQFFFLVVLPCCFVFAEQENCVKTLQDSFRGVDFYTGTGIKDVSGTYSLNDTAGIGVRFDDFKCIVSCSSDKSVRCGLSFHVPRRCFRYDTTFFAGNLRFSGALSRLKHPWFSSSSVMKSCSLLSPGIEPALPSFTSVKKPVSCALKCLSPSFSFFLPSFDIAVSEDGELYVSAFKRFNFQNLLRLSLSCTKASFRYGVQPSKSWFYKKRPFKTNAYSSGDFECGIAVLDVFKSFSAIGFSESPFDGLSGSGFWGRSENQISLNGFSFRFSIFKDFDRALILPGGKTMNIHSQYLINPKISFDSENAAFKLGILLEQEEKEQQNGKIKEEMVSYSLKLGSSFSIFRCKVAAEFSNNFCTDRTSVSEKVNVRFSYKGNRLVSTSSLSALLQDSKRTYTVKETFQPAYGIISSIYIGGTRTYESSVYKNGTFFTGVTLTHMGSHLNWQGKINFKSTF